jgi:hypothetical protein
LAARHQILFCFRQAMEVVNPLINFLIRSGDGILPGA